MKMYNLFNFHNDTVEEKDQYFFAKKMYCSFIGKIAKHMRSNFVISFSLPLPLSLSSPSSLKYTLISKYHYIDNVSPFLFVFMHVMSVIFCCLTKIHGFVLSNLGKSKPCLDD